MLLKFRFLSLYLALKYLRSGSQSSFVNFLTKLALVAIGLSSFALMLTLMISSGFEREIYKNLQGLNSDATLSLPEEKFEYLQAARLLQKHFSSKVKSFAGTCLAQALVEQDGSYSPVFFQGIDTTSFLKVSDLQSKIFQTLSKPHLPSLLKDKQVILGHKLAKLFNLKAGSDFTLLIPEVINKKKMALKRQQLQVAGIIKTGLDDFDSNLIVGSLSQYYGIFQEEGYVDKVMLKLKPQLQARMSWWHKAVVFLQEQALGRQSDDGYERVQGMQRKLDKLGSKLKIEHWTQRSPALLSSLKLDKFVISLLLSLILLIALVNIIALLYVKVQLKRHDIAILRALGATPGIIYRTFVYQGLLLVGSATLVGQALALVAGLFLQKYPLIQLPEIYVISYVPVNLDWHLFITLFGITLLLTFFITLLPARIAQKVQVAALLRAG